MADDEKPQETRTARRQKVLKAGKILLPGKMSVLDCTIRDVSETGAKLLLGDIGAVGNEFRLVFLAENVARDVKVAWRRTGMIGVAFTGEAKRAPPRKW